MAAGVQATAWSADHASGAPALMLRLAVGGKVVTYTGDTAWTDALIDAAAGADLLIAEAYFRDKKIPYHLSHADLAGHASQLGCGRVVLTHLSADLLAQLDQCRDHGWDFAEDDLVLRL